MKQLNLFDKEPTHQKTKIHWKLFIDGASRNNPGPAGAGIYIIKDAQTFKRDGFFLGNKTNNQAEYLALLIGLFILKKYVGSDERVLIISDSQLLIRQLKGEYKVRNVELKLLFAVAQQWVSELNAQLMHVLRIENQEADAMANYGIEKKKKLPQDFITILKKNEITL